LSKGVLVDLTKCIGCGSCSVACKMWNALPYGHTTRQQGSGLDADTWTVINRAEVQKDNEPAWRFIKYQCLHCDEPACASACFSKALKKTKEGPVVYDVSLCVGCRYCMLACPFNVPKYEWDKAFPEVRKCQMCANRVYNGDSPACVSVCPSGALTYGDHKTILAIAREKINGDGGYVKHIFGEKEAGGTSWLYISDIPFENLGFRTNVTTKPLPEYTESILGLTPAVGLGWGALLTGMYVYNRRRNEIAKEKEKPGKK
jgi:formate dehydrogenase iron-sulfur subunit